MPDAPRHAPADVPSLAFTWTVADGEVAVDAVRKFLADAGVTMTIPADIPELLAKMRESERKGRPPQYGRNMIEMRLMVVADKELERAGDPRRMVRALDEGPQRVWLLVTPEQRAALVAQGRKLASSGFPPEMLWNLASLPLAIVSIVLGLLAFKRGDSYYVAAGLAYAAWFGSRILIRKKLAATGA
jgi:hypothetical protein